MQAFLISDNNDSLVGIRLAGIPGVVVREREEAARALDEALRNPELGLLVVTEGVAQMIPEPLQHLRESGELPLVVEIPDRHGSTRGPDFLTRYVREAIGVKME